jgi:hypothetical protein
MRSLRPLPKSVTLGGDANRRSLVLSETSSCTRAPVLNIRAYLESDELRAIFETIDRSTAAGRRDYALLAVITLFRAAMVGALTEDHLRCLLTESGEMRRWKEAEYETPEGFEVLYPPPPLDADALIRLAESASRLEQLDGG